MSTLKATILQNFATIGIPEPEERSNDGSSVCQMNRSWSVLGLSEHLIDLEKLKGLQHLRTRRLDLVIHDGVSLAHLNLQAFKLFQSEFATSTVNKSIANFITADGSLLFCLQSSGDIHILFQELDRLKLIKKPSFLKLTTNSRWYSRVTSKIKNLFGGSSQVTPEDLLDTPLRRPLSLVSAQSSLWWDSQASPSFSLKGLTDEMRTLFPFVTTLPDGLSILCCYSPTDCFIFVSTYETALRVKTVQNVRTTEVPGKWFRIIIHKQFITDWLEERKTKPVFQARLCDTPKSSNYSGEGIIQGGMLYGAMENLRLELVYGVIMKKHEKYTIPWDICHFDVDWALRETDGVPYSLGSKFVTRLSNDCRKVCVVVCNHLGIYVHIQEILGGTGSPVQMKRQKVAVCNHSDFDGFHFYKQECWATDVQWLVEDAYIAVMTSCGALSIFYSSGEAMILKVRKPGPLINDDKTARFFYPVFHPHQIVREEGTQPMDRLMGHGYPKVKWMNGEQVLTCSSGTKIELFEIRRVIPLKVGQEVNEIWLGKEDFDVMLLDNDNAPPARIEEVEEGENVEIMETNEAACVVEKGGEEEDGSVGESETETEKEVLDNIIDQTVENEHVKETCASAGRKLSWDEELRQQLKFTSIHEQGNDYLESLEMRDHQIEQSLEDTSGESELNSRENLDMVRDDDGNMGQEEEKTEDISDDDQQINNTGCLEVPSKAEVENNDNVKENDDVALVKKSTSETIDTLLENIPLENEDLVQKPMTLPNCDYVPLQIEELVVELPVFTGINDLLPPSYREESAQTINDENHSVKQRVDTNLIEFPPIHIPSILRVNSTEAERKKEPNSSLDLHTGPEMIPLTTFSQTHSLARVVAYNDDYSDGSCSEPDVDGTNGFLAPATTPTYDLPQAPDLKPSNQYMADDEAEEEECPDIRVPQVHWAGNEANSSGQPQSKNHSIEEIVAAIPLRKDTPIEEESSEYPIPSSSNDDTQYSSPFSCPPTTAEVSDTDQEATRVHIPPKSIPPPPPIRHGRAPPVSLPPGTPIPLGTPSAILQIPPVPQISGVILCPEQQPHSPKQHQFTRYISPLTKQPEIIAPVHTAPSSRRPINVADSDTPAVLPQSPILAAGIAEPEDVTTLFSSAFTTPSPSIQKL